jgi:DNA-binding NtrC family response regulator
VVASCEDIRAASRCSPSGESTCCFLDVQMPGGDGFELLADLPGEMPVVVFVTAHADHAVRALDRRATDYLPGCSTTSAFARRCAGGSRLERRREDGLAARLGALLGGGARSHLVVRTPGRVSFLRRTRSSGSTPPATRCASAPAAPFTGCARR